MWRQALFVLAAAAASTLVLVVPTPPPPLLPLRFATKLLGALGRGAMATRRFPDDFIFGTATAAYQIEGAAAEGGRAPSIWDDFSHTTGKVVDGDTGDVACDHYHLFESDVKLVASLGTSAYRFSVSWPRILPRGVAGGLNQEGVDFYKRLLVALKAAGVEPVVTLYHWDLPSAVHNATGGWADPRGTVAEEFAEYARICFQEFGGDVKQWITLNEPWCSSLLGYVTGEHAPGNTDSPGVEPYRAAHNLLRAHAAAVKVYRADFQKEQEGTIGITLNSDWAVAKANSGEEGKAAVKRYLDFNLGWFADPVWKGDYPAVMREVVGERLPKFTDDEKMELKGSADFFGLNHYSTHIVSAAAEDGSDDDTGPSFWKDEALSKEADPRWPRTDMGWSVVPQGLRGVLGYIHRTYSPPGGIIVTENGLAAVEPDLAAALSDTARIVFYGSYISAVHDALDDGVDVRGYFLWSLLDNFEWACKYLNFEIVAQQNLLRFLLLKTAFLTVFVSDALFALSWSAGGYGKRFGLFFVDYNTQERTAKPAVAWYKQLIAERVLPSSGTAGASSS